LKRLVKRVLGGCGAMFAVIALLVGGLAVRFAVAPVSLDFLSDSLAAQVNRLLPGLGFGFDTASLAWRPQTGQIDLIFGDVRMGDAAAGTRIEIPSIEARVNALALLRGRLEPRDILVRGPRFSVAWSLGALTRVSPDGSSGAALSMSEAVSLPPRLRRVIDALGQSSPDAPLTTLRNLRLEEADIVLRERESGLTWTLPQTVVDLSRRPQGVVLDVAGALMSPSGADGSAQSRLAISGRVSSDAQPDSLSVTLEAFRADRFLGDLPLLSQLAGVGMPLDILLAVSLPGDSNAPDIGLAIKSRGGEVNLPAVYRAPKRFGAVDMQIRFDPLARMLFVDRASIGLDAATLDWSGRVALSDIGEITAIDAEAGIPQIGLRELLNYWPRDLAAGAWRWMDERMPAARLANLDLQYAAAGPRLETDSLRLTFDLDGADAHVLPPAPPLLNASGHAVLTAQALAIDLDGGTIDGLSVAGSRVILDDLDRSDVQYGDVSLRVSEALPDILRLIDHPPLGYASAFGIAPDDMRGAADVTARLRFPLLADLPLSDVDIDIRAELVDLAIPDLYDGDGLERGSMILSVTGARLEGRGQGVFSGIPLDFRWDEVFDPAADALPSRYEIRTRLPADGLARLGIDPGTRLSGPLELALTLEGRGPSMQRISATVDLADAALDLSELNWRKPTDMPAALSIAASATAEGWRIDDLRLSAAGETAIAASAMLGRDAGLQSLTIERLAVGETSLSGHVARTAADGLHVVLSGPSIDLRGLLGDTLQTEEGADDDPLAELTRFALDLRAGRALAMDGVAFRDLSVSLVRAPDRWRRVMASAAQDEEADARLSLLPRESDERGPRSFSLTSGNAGNLMLGLGLLKNIDGGALDLQADLDLDGADLKADGALRLRDFVFVVPEDARYESDGDDAEASPLSSYVDDDGIAFDLAELPFRLEDGIYDIEGARVNGPDIGLTLEGQVDRYFRRLNVNGVIVPAYRFNSFLGKIPIIGGLFSGGEGGGLFALSYRVEGRLPEPDVSINPMTAIMPGILRWPFEGSKGQLEPNDEVNEESPAAPQGPPRQ